MEIKPNRDDVHSCSQNTCNDEVS